MTLRRPRSRVDVILGRVFAALFAVGVATCAGTFVYLNRGAFLRPADVEVAQPAAAVRDARSLLAAPHRGREVLEPSALPPSLRLPGLRYANVDRDHVDLVLARNPDVALGARIWALHHRPHLDTPTRYRDIFFYRYTNDAPETVDNIP